MTLRKFWSCGSDDVIRIIFMLGKDQPNALE